MTRAAAACEHEISRRGAVFKTVLNG